VLNILLVKLYKNKPRHIFINNVSAATCFGSVGNLQVKNLQFNLQISRILYNLFNVYYFL